MYSNKKHIFAISEVPMKQLLFFILFSVFITGTISAQNPSPNGVRITQDPENNGGGIERKFSEKKDKQKRAPANSYKIISIERDTTYADTSLTIHKEYKFNYLRKDDFELESFVNIGSPFTQLVKQEQHFDVAPNFGATARHIGYLEAEDINYFQAATPFTELYFKTALEQGQQLDAFITINTKPNFNFSLAYKGVRSLGAFQSSLTSTRSFRGTLSYNTVNERYYLNAHFTDQRLLNQENGGLDDRGVSDFVSITAESDDRAILTTQFQNAENLLNGKRYFIDHEYRLSKGDSLGNGKLAVGHQLEYTRKEYTFDQTDPDESFFGSIQSDAEFQDSVELDLLQNKASVSYKDKNLGALGFFAKHTFYNYGYDNILALVDENGNFRRAVTDRLSDELISLGASYKNTYKGFLLQGNAESVISGPFSNQHLLGPAGYNYKDKFNIKFGYELKSEAQSFNKQLYQSNYIDYFYQNDFDNTVTNTFSVDVASKKDLWLKASFSIIDKYAYFERIPSSQNPEDFDPDELTQVSSPTQTDDTFSLLKIKGFKEFKYRSFRLANTAVFQQVSGDDIDFYNVPTITTRNSLYFQDEIFKRAMFLQTGITFKYFSSYYADGYDALLAENYVQSEVERVNEDGEVEVIGRTEIGGFPQLDFFLNAKVRQTRIFFKLENAQGLISGQNNDLIAPNFASRDFLIRFGLVWNFYL